MVSNVVDVLVSGKCLTCGVCCSTCSVLVIDVSARMKSKCIRWQHSTPELFTNINDIFIVLLIVIDIYDLLIYQRYWYSQSRIYCQMIYSNMHYSEQCNQIRLCNCMNIDFTKLVMISSIFDARLTPIRSNVSWVYCPWYTPWLWSCNLVVETDTR